MDKTLVSILLITFAEAEAKSFQGKKGSFQTLLNQEAH